MRKKIKVLIIAGSALTNTDMSSYLMDSLADLGLKMGSDRGNFSEDMLQNISYAGKEAIRELGSYRN